MSVLTSILPLSPHSRHRPLRLLPHPRLSTRAEMSSSSSSSELPPLPRDRIVLGCGLITVDYLAAVAEFPKPDDKIRSTSLKVEGGGNVGNALTGTARLGLKPRVISKVASDDQGRNILRELESDGVDTSYIVVAEEGNSPFTYIIVDNQMKTRTCIHTPGYPAMVPDELPEATLLSALEGTTLVYFDVRLHDTALIIAKECRQLREIYLF